MSAQASRGATILELALAVSLFAMAIGGIYGFIATGNRAVTITNDFVQTQAQLRSAMNNVIDELRWGQRVTAASATAVTVLIPRSTPFSASSLYTVTFAYDAASHTVTRSVDPDGPGIKPAGAAVPIGYDVIREDGTSGFTLEYFNAAGTSLGSSPADLSAIVRVRLHVATTRNATTRVFAGDVALRGR
jgi:hypothetical protein